MLFGYSLSSIPQLIPGGTSSSAHLSCWMGGLQGCVSNGTIFPTQCTTFDQGPLGSGPM